MQHPLQTKKPYGERKTINMTATTDGIKKDLNEASGKVRAFIAKFPKGRLSKARQAELENLASRLDEVNERLNNLPTTAAGSMRQAQLNKMQNELTQVTAQFDQLWADANNRLDDHDGRLAAQDKRLDGLDAGYSGLHNHVALLVRSDVVSETRTHPGVWIAATLVGIITGIIWAIVDFSQTLPGGNGLKLVYEFADGPLGAILAGVAAFALLAGVMILLGVVTTTTTITPREQVATQPLQPADVDNQETLVVSTSAGGHT